MIDSEPIITEANPHQNGRPRIAEEQYSKWLDDMRPFLRRGCSLYYALDKCELNRHQTAIYEKYGKKDWFAKKVDALRSTLGEMVNDIVFTVTERVKNKLLQSETALVDESEIKILKLVAEKHRTAQPFFVSRTETAETDDSKIGKIIETLETTNYDDVAREAAKQMVETQPPLQDQG